MDEQIWGSPTGHEASALVDTSMPYGQSNITETHREKVLASSPFQFREILLFLRDFIVIIIVVLIIRKFFIAPFEISGSSMETNYHDKEFILVDKFSYADFFVTKIGDPVRGDVVVLEPHAQKDKEYYIKRIIGIPGDTIKFESGEVAVKTSDSADFVWLREDYLSPINKGKTPLPPDAPTHIFIVPEGKYFVMGDNRNNSSDSRTCFLSCTLPGSDYFVTREHVIGRVFLDLGYFMFLTPDYRLSLTWLHRPRFFDTAHSWVYPELSGEEK